MVKRDETPANTQTGNLDNRTWSDVFRCIAITGVFSEHWFEEFPTDGSAGIGVTLINLAYRAGSLVQLFFLLSGYSLAIGAYKHSGNIDWKQWYFRRFCKILIPFWITCILIFIGSYVLSIGLQRTAFSPISFLDLIWNLLLLRNQFPSADELNAAYWFVPVIIGLYLVFPLLWKLLQFVNPIRFLTANLLIQTTAIAIGFSIGWDGSHPSSVFVFHLLPFAIGMVIGRMHGQNRQFLDRFESIHWPILGVLFLGAATVMSNYGTLLSANNDAFSVLGYFVLCYFVFQRAITKIPKLSSTLALGGRISFTFYLIHLPLLQLITSQMRSWSVEQYAYRIIAIGVVVHLTIMAIAWFIEKQISRIGLKPKRQSTQLAQFSQR